MAAAAQNAPKNQQTNNVPHQIILTRITNDERPLRRVIKKFHNYTSVSHTPIVPWVSPDGSPPPSVEEAREAFLLELSSFELLLKKSDMICKAEVRQVEEYQKERQRLDDEHGALRGQIDQLKNALEQAQLARRRKIEYDLVAEKVNTIPSREELERCIQELENDMVAIRTEQDHQTRMMHGQKSALDTIISELTSLHVVGKDSRDAAATSASATPAPEGNEVEMVDPPTDAGATTAPASEVADEREEGEEDKAPSESDRRSAPAEDGVAADDIEMGEVEEDSPKNLKGKKKLREDLEEGEASDSSSALSDPPDDDD
ncbi:Tho complex subunit 7-domain-containing protein [Infundibulicybe gibba]|nr:Tho complex subunit 7-domain-containing protein [Infundibulicybe gibba]